MLCRLADKQCQASVRVSTGRVVNTSFSFRRIWMSSMTHECSYAPQYNTFKQKQFIFWRMKDSMMPAGKWCFERGPKTHIFVMDWEDLHHQVSNLCSSQGIYEGKQLPPMALWKLESTSSVSLPGIKHAEIPGQTSHMDYFSRRAQDWGSTQNESVNYQNWAKITKLGLQHSSSLQAWASTHYNKVRQPA